MAALETIAEAIKLIDSKKESLKKAFGDLQAQSSLLSSFSLTWSDIESHFASVETSIAQKFELLESLESACQQQQQRQKREEEAVSNARTDPHIPVLTESVEIQDEPITSPGDAEANEPPSSSSDPPSQCPIEPRAELKVLCSNMDSLGLRNYIAEHHVERDQLRAELSGALGLSSDPGKLVLDAMGGFYGDGISERNLMVLRRNCIFLLEVLMSVRPSLTDQARESSKKVALDWKGKLNPEGPRHPMQVLGLLDLVAAYGLMSEFSVDEIIDYCVTVAHFSQSRELFRALGLEDKVPDLIEKLISKRKYTQAVKFIFDFELTQKFPPLPLLKFFVNESKKLARKVSKDGNNSRKSQNAAMAQEIIALKSVVKIMEERKLDSEFRATLERRIQLLEKLKTEKFPAVATASKPQQQLQKQKLKPQFSGKKRPRPSTAFGSIAASMKIAGPTSAVATFQQSHPQTASVAPASYLSTPAGVYAMVGNNPAIVPYTGPSNGLYGLAGAPVGFPGDPSPARPYLYPSELQMPSIPYDRSTTYGGQGASSQYFASYYTR
ncbi:truncated FRIGIDA-like protein 1 [Rhodamnia argentea]|uniref:FRIGIDA-like protein n=1 Tax=Rhodamnia argentea TaxID=178133 RepID=A0A8B8Q2X2_9MYRT|nr:truncated FRIGIDA-like protein 1 [Rhodamnia argentea]XP_030541435.1 truncated FRIGIDA-like protein 1 [Rhodamnia argentea]